MSKFTNSTSSSEGAGVHTGEHEAGREVATSLAASVLMLGDGPVARDVEAALQATGVSVQRAEGASEQSIESDIVVLFAAADSDRAAECASVRRASSHAGLMVIDAAADRRGAVECLRSGADDWVHAQTPTDEIVARVEALARRLSRSARVLRIADLELNVDQRTAKRGQKTIPLTNREFVLLEYMMRRPDTVLSRGEISRGVWNAPEDAGSNVIDVYVSMLRRKIDKGFPNPLIRTIIGSGYVLGASTPRR